MCELGSDVSIRLCVCQGSSMSLQAPPLPTVPWCAREPGEVPDCSLYMTIKNNNN